MKDRILTTAELLAAIHWTTESVQESNASTDDDSGKDTDR